MMSGNRQFNNKNKYINVFNQLSNRPACQTVLSLVLLVGGFAALMYGFHALDYYHNHFFERGWVAVGYNLLRAAIVPYLIWVMYASGYGVVAIFTRESERRKYSITDSLVLGFGVGLGCWHLLMLVLGYFNLYYTSVMLGICLLVLTFSANHFKQRWHDMMLARRSFMRENTTLKIVMTFSMVIGLIWLLMVCGLYPGGGGDYFTHYFYYYTNVINNHGLAPNDVWYHYYYSKGSGLHFLGMLLMDPEAPALMTYSCAVVAVIALYNLLGKVAPKTLWPEFCAFLYMLYNLNGFNGSEFQKTHEETTVMVILAVWAICLYAMRPKQWAKPAFIMLASLITAAAFITQAITIYFAFFFGAQVVIAYFTQNRSKLTFYFLLGVIASLAVLTAFLLNYIDTGLATDQALNITWKFANVEKLHEWGVLPNVMLVAWIRGNYDLVAVPWAFMTVSTQLFKFMRIESLSALLVLCMLGVIVYASRLWARRKKHAIREMLLTAGVSKFLPMIKNIGLLITVFAVLSIFAGHSQEVSYLRFCSFFYPLLVLLCATIFAFLSFNMPRATTIPIVVFLAVLMTWQYSGSDIQRRMKYARRYVMGKYSLADAYAHLPSGMAFGGINPGTYMAMQHVPKGARVWSTNVSSYCMAPNCQVESVISFKLSSRLNEILNGTPKQAKRILKSEGLNYFIVSTKLDLIDILPYSNLFSASNMAKYFGIKWTDGETYLLTWRENGAKKLPHKFVKQYAAFLKRPEHPWFRFREAKYVMNQAMQSFKQSGNQTVSLDTFRKRYPKHNGIIIHHASYGRNCSLHRLSLNVDRVSANNATTILKALCQYKKRCDFIVNQKTFGNPAEGCAKSLHVSYWCKSRATALNEKVIAADALGKRVLLTC